MSESNAGVSIGCRVDGMIHLHHLWSARPLHSLRLVQRYICTRCKLWGWRQFRCGKTGSIEVYSPAKQRDMAKMDARVTYETHHYPDSSPEVEPGYEELQVRERAGAHRNDHPRATLFDK
jgi:hypothetical protein